MVKSQFIERVLDITIRDVVSQQTFFIFVRDTFIYYIPDRVSYTKDLKKTIVLLPTSGYKPKTLELDFTDFELLSDILRFNC